MFHDNLKTSFLLKVALMVIKKYLDERVYDPIIYKLTSFEVQKPSPFPLREVTFLFLSATVPSFVLFVFDLKTWGLYLLYFLPLIYGLFVGLFYPADGSIQLASDSDKILWLASPVSILLYILTWSTSGQNGFNLERFKEILPETEVLIAIILNVLLGKLIMILEVALLLQIRNAISKLIRKD